MSDVPAPYQELKLAERLFGKAPEALNPSERQRVRSAAARQRAIETLILAAPEALGVVLPAAAVDATVAGIRERFGSEDEYAADLARSGLTPATLRQAISCDLAVEAVLERVGARAAPVSATEVEIFWFMHRERFRRPEHRRLRHLLITVNDGIPGSDRDAARARIEAIALRLRKDAGRFAEQALKHSECPTALNGGLLGAVPRGQLYPQLDDAAFVLAVGELSDIVETEIGFHLVQCDAIEPEREQSAADAAPRIREHLEGQRRAMCQKGWINSLSSRERMTA